MTQLERQLLRYEGMPVHAVARAIGCTDDQVRAGRAALRRRGVLRDGPDHQGPAHERLNFNEVDRMMRGNRAPREPLDPEIGWTPDTDGCW